YTREGSPGTPTRRSSSRIRSSRSGIVALHGDGLAEANGERLAGTVERRLDRALADAQGAGDVGDVHVQVVAEHGRLALAPREGLERGRDVDSDVDVRRGRGELGA